VKIMEPLLRRGLSVGKDRRDGKSRAQLVRYHAVTFKVCAGLRVGVAYLSSGGVDASLITSEF
jgi:hypothetical protein